MAYTAIHRHARISARKVRGGELTVAGGVYSLDTGKVEWLGSYPEGSTVPTQH